MIAVLRVPDDVAFNAIVVAGPLENFSNSFAAFRIVEFANVMVKFERVAVSRSAIFVPPALKFTGVPVLNSS